MARFTVVGAGLGGALMATLLARREHEVEVFERRADPRRAGAEGGRSINLALSTRGLQALELAGVKERVMEMAVPMRGRMIHSSTGRLTFQPYGTAAHHVIQSVSRGGLNRVLVDAAEAAGAQVEFQRLVSGLQPEKGTLTLRHQARGAISQAAADVIIGADGAFSVVRSRLQRSEGFDYQQSYLEHGYKELTIPPAPGGGFAMEAEALHIWPRGAFMMIALPNLDGSFTCTLFWPHQGPHSFAAIGDETQLLSFFRQTFPDAVALMPSLGRDYFANPTGSLVTVRCRPWHRAGRVVLLGDACHAVVPFYGQGANAAFEDCVTLDDSLRGHGPDWNAAFIDYQERRLTHANVLADLALANFIEMRDHTASRLFLARKLLERVLHRLFPWWFLPLYSMVTFSRIPYADAVRRDRRQWTGVILAAAGLLLAATLLAAWWIRQP